MADGGLSIGLMAASQMFSAGGEASQLRAAAGVDEENARRAELEGALSIEDAQRRGRAVQGEAAAALGTSGAAIGGQSAQDLLFQNQLEIEYDILSRRYGAGSEAHASRTSAARKRAAAKGAMFGGILRAGAAALTGMDQLADVRAGAANREKLLAARFPGALRLPMPPSRNSPWYIGAGFDPPRPGYSTPGIGEGDPRVRSWVSSQGRR